MNIIWEDLRHARLSAFAFRFNRRHTRDAAVHSLLGIAMRAKPITYKMLISPDRAG